MQLEISVTIGGLDALAASISDLAEALKAGVTANEVIAKAATRKPRTPVAAPVVEEPVVEAPAEPVTPAPGKPEAEAAHPSADAAPGPVESTAPPSEPAIAPAQAPIQAIPGAGIDETSEVFLTARGLVLALSKTKGREITLATLAPFGVERISQIKDVATLLAFSAAAQKVLA